MKNLHIPAIVLGSLLAFGAHAQQTGEGTERAKDIPTIDQPNEDKQQDSTMDEKDNQQRSLDGDRHPEGKHGDSTHQSNPGGSQGDGRTDPGVLE